MLKRCYSISMQSKNPAYEGVTVCEEWFTFSNFKVWMVGKDWEGKQLDKDLLVEGNKVYSPDTCVFVSGVVNTFVTDCKGSRGDHPIGVHFDKKTNKYQSGCSNPLTRKHEFLGYFTCPQEAYRSWKTRKLQLVYELFNAGEITDERVFEVLIDKYI